MKLLVIMANDDGDAEEYAVYENIDEELIENFASTES